MAASVRRRARLIGVRVAIMFPSSSIRKLSPGGTTAVAINGCDNDWQTWWVGSRTQWNVTKDFYMGVDVLYSKLESANFVNAGTFAAPTGVTTDVDNWMFRFRVHRDFYP